MKQPNKKGYLSIKIETDIKSELDDLAKTKGMDLSKLTRAVLTNYVRPNTFSL